MTCRSVRARLPQYQDGELPADERSAIEQHLRACETCACEYAELRGVVALLGSLTKAEPSADFTANVLQAVAHESIAEPARPAVSLGLVLAGVSLVLSTVIVAGLAGFGPLDLSAWQAALASGATAFAKLFALLAEASVPITDALLEGLAGPVAWLLLADVIALMAVLAFGRRLLSARALRNVSSLLAL
jgi:anti-sigma factor RsiW